ncbi:SusC/RagA family TonB-linked outer membrane protein [Chitinophaga caeni]|uniref:SusC/RagA family TonB-linked outer membrane protein n=2 Tax=Chitinophaga caeni TaxID=2029983 RepID=A0A291QZD7_9BACT|nr:SusC/RagA family TonB-linked outer membrane protein [Chitinophaga caeni]
MQKIYLFRLQRSYRPPACKRAGRLINQIWRVMRLTVLLLTVAFMSVHATGVAQHLSISGKKLTLKKVFNAIENQTGYVVLANKKLFSQNDTFSLSVEDMPLKDFLNRLSKDQSLKYVIQDKTIVMSRREPVPVTIQSLLDAIPVQISLSGQILDATNNEPVIGVTIRIKNSSKGTTADASGRFQLSELAEDAVLLISSIGYTSVEIPAQQLQSFTAGEPHTLQHVKVLKLDSGTFIIYLQRSTNKLDESVVVAYGTTTQRYNTGSVSSVKAEDIEKQPVSNVLEALQGNVPGLYISQTNGNIGSRMNISIRQQQSINSKNMPLFIIDGVPFVETSFASAGASGNIDPMNSINPADIASISVLKDADATAIYGSRGANGVILITTKKGKASEPHFDFNIYTGGGKVVNYMPMLNLDEYLDMRHAGFANDNTTPDFSNAPDLTVWDTTQSRNFQKDYIGGTANQTEVTGAFSGGNQYLRYRFSNTFRHQTTPFPGDWGYKRYSSHLSVDNTSRNGKFGLSASAMYTKESNNQVASDLTRYVYILPPNYPVYNEDGSLNWTGGFTNPESFLLQSAEFKSDNLLANASLRYNILPGLDAKVSLGYNKISQTNNTYLPKSSLNPASSNGQSAATYTSDYIESYIVEPQLTYNRTLGNGRLSVLLGATWQQSSFAEPYFIRATGFSNDRLMSSWTAATDITSKSSSFNEYKYVSGFGRINYIMKDRYILNITGRRDGSSRFGPNHQFGNFGSAGAGWIFSNEPWFKQALPWMSYGKLRASYGTSGNDQIADYGYLATYGNLFYQYGSTGIYPLRSANPDYRWEANRKLDIGLETGLFDDQIFLSASWFSSRTDNQLVSSPLSAQSGFTSFTGNMPALLQTSGWEFELKTKNISRKNFTWNSSFNITLPRNKLISFPGIETTIYAYTLMEGKPISNLNGYRYTGLKDGIVTVADLNNDGKITTGLLETANGDYYIVASSLPDYYGGFSNSIKLGRFQFDFLLQFVKQRKGSIRNAVNIQPGALSNQDYQIISDGFRPSVLSSSEATYAYKNYYLLSDASYSDASFIRLKNVNLSYELPGSWAKTIRIKSSGAFIRAQNLLTITNYLGFDPETGGAALPPLRQITAGIHCSL